MRVTPDECIEVLTTNTDQENGRSKKWSVTIIECCSLLEIYIYIYIVFLILPVPII